MKSALLPGFIFLACVCHAQSWTRVTEVPLTSVYCIELHNSTLYAGTNDRVYIGTNNGSQWTPSVSQGNNIGSVETITLFNNKLFAGTFYGGVFVSTDMGAHWQPANNGLGINSISKFVIWKGNLYAATYGDGFYKYNDNTGQWALFNNGFSTSVDGNVYDLAVTDSTLIAGAGANGYFYKYNPTTAVWDYFTYFATNSPGLQVYSLLVEGNTFYAGTFNYTLRSNDKGHTWSFDRTGLHAGIQVLAAGNEKDYVAVNSFDGGLNSIRFYARNRNVPTGTAWTILDSVTDDFCYRMVVVGGRLYAARDSGLFYMQTEAVTAAPDVNATVQDLRLFPNPARGSSNLSIRLRTAKKVSVELIDASGKQVSVLFSGLGLKAGENLLPVNLQHLPAAVYFIRIMIGSDQYARKLEVF